MPGDRERPRNGGPAPVLASEHTVGSGRRRTPHRPPVAGVEGCCAVHPRRRVRSWTVWPSSRGLSGRPSTQGPPVDDLAAPNMPTPATGSRRSTNSLLAKVIAHGRTARTCLRRMGRALAEFDCAGRVDRHDIHRGVTGRPELPIRRLRPGPEPGHDARRKVPAP